MKLTKESTKNIPKWTNLSHGIILGILGILSELTKHVAVKIKKPIITGRRMYRIYFLIFKLMTPKINFQR